MVCDHAWRGMRCDVLARVIGGVEMRAVNHRPDRDPWWGWGVAAVAGVPLGIVVMR